MRKFNTNTNMYYIAPPTQKIPVVCAIQSPHLNNLNNFEPAALDLSDSMSSATTNSTTTWDLGSSSSLGVSNFPVEEDLFKIATKHNRRKRRAQRIKNLRRVAGVVIPIGVLIFLLFSTIVSKFAKSGEQAQDPVESENFLAQLFAGNLFSSFGE